MLPPECSPQSVPSPKLNSCVSSIEYVYFTDGFVLDVRKASPGQCPNLILPTFSQLCSTVSNNDDSVALNGFVTVTAVQH